MWSSGVSPKKASKIQLRDVDLRSVGPSVQKLWPKTFFAKKMPCILHCNAKKIRDTISRQVSGLAQLPDDLKFIVDKESNTYKSGGVTSSILCHPTTHANAMEIKIENRKNQIFSNCTSSMLLLSPKPVKLYQTFIRHKTL